MPKFSKSKLLNALSAAEKARPIRPNPFQAQFSNSPGRLTSQRASERLLVTSLAKAGLDVKELKKFREQNKAAFQRIIEKEQRSGVKQASKARAIVNSHIASRRKALEARAVAPLAPPYTITLDKPFLIWASPHSNIIDDSRIESENSWAKVKIEAGSSTWGSEKLSFYFIWDNPSEYHAVINAATYLALTGYCQAYAEGSFWHFYTGNLAGLSLTGYLYAWEWWNQPPTLTRYDQEYLGGVGAQAGLTDDSGLTVFAGVYDLGTDSVVVAPQATIVFEVALAFDYSVVGGGHISADFEYGTLDIRCPHIEISLLTAPPLNSWQAPPAVQIRSA
jgi:hypothetical protein